MISLVLFTAFLVFSAAEYPADHEYKSIAKADVDYRLPPNIIPLFYTVVLDLNLRNGTYIGQTEIFAYVLLETSVITMHSYQLSNLRVNYITLSDDPSQIWTAIDVTLDEERQFLIITLDRPLVPSSTFKININYERELDIGMLGFYRGSYTNEIGELKYFAATQFQSIFARTAFPCFDEPGMKAMFQVSIVRESTELALSNGILYGTFAA